MSENNTTEILEYIQNLSSVKTGDEYEVLPQHLKLLVSLSEKHQSVKMVKTVEYWNKWLNSNIFLNIYGIYI